MAPVRRRGARFRRTLHECLRSRAVRPRGTPSRAGYMHSARRLACASRPGSDRRAFGHRSRRHCSWRLDGVGRDHGGASRVPGPHAQPHRSRSQSARSGIGARAAGGADRRGDPFVARYTGRCRGLSARRASRARRVLAGGARTPGHARRRGCPRMLAAHRIDITDSVVRKPDRSGSRPPGRRHQSCQGFRAGRCVHLGP